ncbi:MAG: LacI family transcriptional regulator [Verrucomicrobiota bacterium]|nr:LacI family transcriptional regulator [Verrucomicrobiota bacterium]
MADVPTIRSLAKIAGVSSATVSLALRNHPRIRPHVRKRIQRIADEAGYKPNPIVSHLIAQVRASKRASYQSTLGVVFTTTDPGHLEVPTFKEWIAACEMRARQLGYSFDQFVLLRSGLSPQRLIKILDARGIKGLFKLGPFVRGAIPSEFDIIWKRSSTIVLGARPTRPPLSAVMNDQFSTAGQAVEEVTRLGYRRVGLCIHPEIEDVVEHRFMGGFLAGQSRLPKEDRVPPCPFEYGDKKTFQQWVRQHRPDVILTLHHQIREWLAAMKLRVPEDIGLAHLDHVAELSGWAGMRQNNEQIGVAAVDMLVGQLHRNEFGSPPFQKCMFIGGTWVDGETVRPQEGGDGVRRWSRKKASPAKK